MQDAESERAGADSNRDSGQVDDVGENLDVGVDVDERDGHRDDCRDDDEYDRRSGAQIDSEVEKRVRKLDERIAPGDARTARAATSAQQRETDHGNVVVPADRGIAPRAMTARKDDRFFARIPMDDDVEKTADDRADGKGVKAEQQRHCGDCRRKAFHAPRLRVPA